MDDFKSWGMLRAEELRDYVEQNGVSRVAEYVTSKLDAWKNVVIQFAVCGVSGAGKSTFINRIRGLEDFDTDAAEVDVTECTKEPKCYDHPSNPKIKFWDLPGITNPFYKGDLEEYCKNVPLDEYDTYLIFAKDRLTADDLKLAERIRSTGKKFFFIRARIDQDVENAKRSRKHLFDKDATLNKIRKNISQNLIEGGLLNDEKEIFLISNHFPTKYQFDELTQAILAILPQRQRESLILTIDNALILSKNTLKEKVKVLKERIKFVATASAFAATVPIPGVSISADIAMIQSEINFYISQLGLSQEGSNRFSLLVSNTQTQIKALSTVLGSTMQIGGLLTAYATESVVKEFSRYIPFIGTAIGSSLSFGATYYLLSKWLGQMEEIALKALEETLENVRSH
ncbi:interferon-inducible GTPase 5-like [Pocillopora verrucosa]|uniref:interferon-inducible GTPase 5-like n=1 Tax=Pocillopora verrucosa TaxID=203993 RepID=UPI00334113AD